MRLRGTNRNFRRVSPRVPFNPRKFFRNGEQGVWYDQSDLRTLFQDSAGTTPVTAVEQPVGLMLDKSRGLVLGSELRSTGVIQTLGTTPVATYNPSTGASIAYRTDVTNQSGIYIPVTRNTLVRLSITVTAGAVHLRNGGISDAIFGAGLGVGTHTVYGFAQLIGGQGAISSVSVSSATSSASFTINSVRELPGAHATQPTAIDRPILRNRYNLLTKTEQFDDAAWTKARTDVTPNAIVAPDGTLTAELLTRNSTTLTCSTQQSISTPIGSRVTLRVRAKAAGVGGFFGLRLQGTYPDRADVLFNLSDGTFAAPASTNFTSVSVPPAIDLGSGWWELSITATVANSALDRVAFGPSAGGSVGAWEGASTTLSNAYVWGASLVPADQASLPYQRVNTATDYDSDPRKFPLYLAANGTNTWMQTNSIDFTGTDNVTVFAGVRKLSDAATGKVIELSLAINGAVVGAFALDAPGGNPATEQIVFGSRGTIARYAIAASGFSAPISSVLTCLGNISGDSVILRINGAQAASSTSDQGAGNYGNYPLYLFRRGGTSLPFNGNFHGLLIRGALTSDPDTLKMEKWLSFKTGVQL